MKPVTFTCQETIAMSGAAIGQNILDVSNWTDFEGYGVMPGIKEASFAKRTPEIVGSQIAVTNEDGSQHVEEIVLWEEGHKIHMKMQGFTKPLASLATSFDELWSFEEQAEGTLVKRSFVMHPKRRWARPLLWLISLLLRRAVARHLRQMREDALRD